MNTKEERIEGIKDVIRIAHKYNLPVFCGNEAFKEIAKVLEVEIQTDPMKFWPIYIEWYDVEVIKCSTLGDLMVLATPYYNMQPLTHSQHMQV